MADVHDSTTTGLRAVAALCLSRHGDRHQPNMRVLIVDAFSGSRDGRLAFRKFDELVRSTFKTVERHEEGRTEYIVRDFIKGIEVCP